MDDKDTIIVAVIMFVLMIFGTISGYFTAKDKYYKQGQIDYANGIIRYQLEKQGDESMIWEKIDEK